MAAPNRTLIAGLLGPDRAIAVGSRSEWFVATDIYVGLRVAAGKCALPMVCMLAGVMLSIIGRTDVNWDLQNYHLYGPFAVLHGGLNADYFVAGFQGYLNPLADMPYYFAKFVLFPGHPVTVAGLAGLPFGMLAFIVFNIARILMPDAPWEAAMAAILGLTGSTVISEIGTAFNDILIADFLLLGLWMVLTRPGNLAFAGISGLAMGCAAGLKLTALLFAPGLLVACLMPMGGRQAVLATTLFCAGVAIGFLALWGWWGALLWERFHNPFFPLFGSIFRSSWMAGVVPPPWATTAGIRDVRFFPRNILQWLFYPFFWLQGQRWVAAEAPVRDPRFAIMYLAMASGLVTLLKGGVRRPSTLVGALCAFVAISYLFWLTGFSILRYALPLEAISGIVVWTAVRPMFRKPVPWVLAVVCVAVIAFTKPYG